MHSKAVFQQIMEDNKKLNDGRMVKSDFLIRGLEYPYFTFDDKDYANFITGMFQ